MSEYPEGWEIRPGELGVGSVYVLTERKRKPRKRKRPVGFPIPTMHPRKAGRGVR